MRRLVVKASDCSSERLCRIAERAGFKVRSGGKHLRVETPQGQFLTTIPHARRLKRETVKGVVERLVELGAAIDLR